MIFFKICINMLVITGLFNKSSRHKLSKLHIDRMSMCFDRGVRTPDHLTTYTY